MATIKPTKKAEMLAAFPEVPPLITGEPTIGELIYILQYLMACTQSHQSYLSLLNALYMCFPEMLYHHCNDANEAYPIDPTNPGPTPVFSLGDDAADHCNIRVQWEYANKNLKM